MARFLRRLADKAERAFNIHVFKRTSAPHWPEAHFERIPFERLGIDCVFDVGANIR